jgi:DNA-binding LacI/PurR family transcriptional regulator
VLDSVELATRWTWKLQWERPAVIASLIEAFLTMRVDGLFMIGLLPVSGTVLSGARSVPTVVSATGELKLPRVDRVLNDDYLGTKLAVEHLASLGHRRVAYLGGITGEVGSARFAGYQEAMTEQGLGKEVLVQTPDFTDRGGHDAAKLLLSRTPRPTGIVGWNDYSAIGALVAADELGLRVPEQLSVVGYDNSHVARLARISLTTVDPMNSEVGRVAGDLLRERLQSRRRPAVARLVTPSLVVRASSGRPMLNSPGV